MMYLLIELSDNLLQAMSIIPKNLLYLKTKTKKLTNTIRKCLPYYLKQIEIALR